MNTKVFKLKYPGEEIAAAADILRSGGLVALPTETVYGLGANGLDAEAVAGVFAAKGRPQDNPLILHLAGLDWLKRYCVGIPPLAYALAEKFWPGPLTLILSRGSMVPDAVTGGLDTVGVRCPDHPVTLDIIRAAGIPIAAPSANRSGKPSPTTAADVLEDMEGRIDAIVDGGACTVGVESTILDLTVTPPRLLRPGGLPLEDLRDVVGEIAIDSAVTTQMGAGDRPRAPGMKYRHYAPKAPVTVVAGTPEESAAYIRSRLEPGDGVLCFDEFLPLFRDFPALSLGSRHDPAEQARRVFADLRAFDRLWVTHIYAQCPEGTGLGLATGNRLKKASGFHIVYPMEEEGKT